MSDFNLRPPCGAHKKKRIVGRGSSSGRGSTAGRGNKGQQSRSGGKAFINAAGVPIAAPSANISGKPSPTKAEHVIADLDGKADAIICGEDSDIGVESTIIDVTGEVPIILRPGGITKEDIIAVCGAAEVSKNVLTDLKETETPRCPGMKYKHYSPDADITVVEGGEANTFEKIKELVEKDRKNGIKTGVLMASKNDFENNLYIFEGKNNSEFAAVLFGALREFDQNGIEKAYVQMCMKDEMELAVKNRLYKSAGHKVIYVGE